MLGKSVLLYTREKRAGRRLTCFLRAAGSEVARVDDTQLAIDLITSRAVHLLLIDYRGAPDEERVIAAASTRIPIVALNTHEHPAILLDLVCERGVRHVLSCSGGTGGLADIDAREVVVTTEKILQADLFGAEKYLHGFAADLSSYQVTRADERDDVVGCVQSYLRWLGTGRELAASIANIADELITNAVYNAPRDEDGNPRYASVDRREKIKLDPWEYVTVRFGSDGEHFVLSVTDWFGALTADRIRDGLIRCFSTGDQIEQKKGGAGLGLYTVLQTCSQLVVNVSEGVRTEIIAVIRMNDNLRSARHSGNSLHLFFDETDQKVSRPMTAEDAETVVVSDSMLVDVRNALAPSQHARDVIALVDEKPRHVEPPKERPRRKRSKTPDPRWGMDVTRVLLSEVHHTDAALQLGLRYLNGHFRSVVLYQPMGRELVATSAEGHVRNWARLSRVRLSLDEGSCLALAARGRKVMPFQPRHAADHRVARHMIGNWGSGGMIVPVFAEDTLVGVMFAAEPLRYEPPVQVLEALRAQLETTIAELEASDDIDIEFEVVHSA